MLSRFLEGSSRSGAGSRAPPTPALSWAGSSAEEPLVESEECSVCSTPLILEECGKLPCGHEIHAACMAGLKNFGLTSNVCPYCRYEAPLGHEGLHDSAVRRLLLIERRVERGEASWGALAEADQTELRAAVREWEEAAEQGHAFAQCSLGSLFLQGHGLEQSAHKALQWTQRAADQGLPEAQYNLALAHERGTGQSADLGAAVTWLRRAADQGHTRALLDLGDMFEEGHGVEQSDTEAARCWRKVAYQGVARAQYNIGVMYREGRGVEQSYLDAGRWYTKAAYQGFAEAQYDLGVMHDKGQGVERSPMEAVRWWRKVSSGLINTHAVWVYACGHAKPAFGFDVFRPPIKITQAPWETWGWHTALATEWSRATARLSGGSRARRSKTIPWLFVTWAACTLKGLAWVRPTRRGPAPCSRPPRAWATPWPPRHSGHWIGQVLVRPSVVPAAAAQKRLLQLLL